MKYNSKELESIAVQPQKYFSREGPLYMKVSSTGTWRRRSKHEAYHEKWCRLRGNLLFYFKGRDLQSAPQGVIVLEQIVIKDDHGEMQPYAFCIEFIGEDNNQYFAAHSAELRDEWVHALQHASYDQLRQQLAYLRKRLIARTGRDLYSADRHGIMAAADINEAGCHEPILEMSVSCRNLTTLPDGRAPSTYISIQCVTPPDSWWAQLGKTEIIESNSDPFFLSTIIFESSWNISPITRLKASVIQVEDRDSNTVSCIGQAVCSIREIVTSPNFEYTMNITDAEDKLTGGNIIFLLWRLDEPDEDGQLEASASSSYQDSTTDGPTLSVASNNQAQRKSFSNTINKRFYSVSKNSMMRGLNCCEIVKSYRVPNTEGSMLQVQEIMEETKLSFIVPVEMLNIFIQEEKKKVEQLHMLGQLSPQWEKARDMVISQHFDMSTQYKETLEHIEKMQKGSSQFKRSVDKGKKELEFVSTNLHLQTMRVSMEQGAKECLYDIITVGAPSAHSLKFKHGGLRRLLQQQAEEPKKGKPLDLNGREDEVVRKIKQLMPEVKQVLEDLWDIAEGHSQAQMQVKAKEVREKITEFLSLLGIPAVQEGHAAFQVAANQSNKPARKTHMYTKNASSAHGPSVKAHLTRPKYLQAKRVQSMNPYQYDGDSDSETSSSKYAAQGRHLSSTGALCDDDLDVYGPCLDFDVPSSQQASSLTCLTNSTYEKMNQLVVGISSLPGNAGKGERCQCIELHLKSLKDILTQIHEQMQFAVAFLLLQEEHNHLDVRQTLQNRSDIVFTQTITSVVAGVVTSLRRNCSSKQFIAQILRIGILMQAESLLSTYGDEMGMLEDMSEGIRAMENVSFEIVPASENTDVIPKISGTRSNVLVKLPLPPNYYSTFQDCAGREFPESSRRIKVVPVLFSVGMNEEQTIAETIGSTALQEQINRENTAILDSYFQRFTQYNGGSVKVQGALSLDVLMSSLKHHVNSKKNKNMEILHVSSQLCRGMNGIRLTSCKSAKDRTAMSVTLEQCHILQNEHQLGPDHFSHFLDTLRSEGTRRDNTRKNVDINMYAFNKAQLLTFPKLYRPPLGTYGKTVST